jgi:CheY-like chemotaxis protein
VAEDENF